MAELSPRMQGERVTEAEEMSLVQAGSATTFALAFARLGGRLGLISRTGGDELGTWMTSTLLDAGIDIAQVWPVPDQLTPLSLASVDSSRKEVVFVLSIPRLERPVGYPACRGCSG